MAIKIYTDGACSGNGQKDSTGGWGVVVCLADNQIKLSGAEKDTTNNRMELTAVIKALEWTHSNLKGKKDTIQIDICSDSSYVVNAMNQNWLNFWMKNNFINSKGEEVKNKDLWLQFIEYVDLLKVNGIRVNFIKVKGHSGVVFNEIADRLATTAINTFRG